MGLACSNDSKEQSEFLKGPFLQVSGFVFRFLEFCIRFLEFLGFGSWGLRV